MQVFILNSYGNALCSMSSDSNAKNVMNFFNDSWKQQTNIPETFEFEVLANNPNCPFSETTSWTTFIHNN